MYRNAKDERAICKIVVSGLESRTVLQVLPEWWNWQTHQLEGLARKHTSSSLVSGTNAVMAEWQTHPAQNRTP